MLRIAVAKGRLGREGIELLENSGYRVPAGVFNSRKLIFTMETEGIELVMVKPADVPIYVEYGTADLGIVGKDTLLEEERSLYEILDLKFGRCRFALAGLPGNDDEDLIYNRVATKYPRFTKRYFREKGEPVEVIKLTGSIELAPLTGLADWILDIVETGRTLKENGLVVIEEIRPLSARLVVNRVSMKTKWAEVDRLVKDLKKEVEGRFVRQ